MSKDKQVKTEEKFKSKIGGQAVIEGVMMRGIDKAAMACRLPSGEIDLEEWPIKGGKNTPIYRKIPFVRGVFVFVTSMIDGYKCLSRSADKQMKAEEDGDEEPSKFEKWVDEKVGDKLMPVITTISIVLGLALAIALFMLLPSGISKLIDKFIVELPSAAKNLMFIVLFSLFDFPQIVRLSAPASPKSMSEKSRLTLFPIPSTASEPRVKLSPAIRFASRAESFAKALGLLSK